MPKRVNFGVALDYIRLLLLAIALLGSAATLAKLLLTSPPQTAVQPVELPASVLLPEWRQSTSQPLVRPANAPLDWSGRVYQYSRGNDLLMIQAVYLGNTSGDVAGLFNKSVPGEAKLTMQYQQGIGFFGLIKLPQKHYLSACITPHAGSTFTTQQFKQGSTSQWYTRLVPWLIGRSKLKDERCLWMLLSLETNRRHSDLSGSAEYLLEQAWFDSYYKWLSQLAKS